MDWQMNSFIFSNCLIQVMAEVIPESIPETLDWEYTLDETPV